MKAWFNQNKIMLISFAVVSILLIIITAIQINYIVQPHVLDELNNYMVTNEITASLTNYVIMVIINFIFFGVWALLFTFIMWKVFFPTKKTTQEAFQVDSLKFLFEIPSNLRKELKRNE